MARAADDDGDKALWLTLAQSWVRFAEHVAREALDVDHRSGDGAMLAVPSRENA